MSSFGCEHPLKQQRSVRWDWKTYFKYITQNQRQIDAKLKIIFTSDLDLKSHNNNLFLFVRETNKMEAVFHLNMRNRNRVNCPY